MDTWKKTAPVTDLGDNGFHILLSTADKDRDGEELHLSQWKTPLPQQVPISADHDMSTSGVVGSGHPELTDRGLEVRGRWADTERAQHVRQLVKSGHLQHVSVEFIRHRDENGVVTRELIGGSFVYTPSNPAAKVLASKGIGVELFELLDRRYATKDAPSADQLVQAVHDAACLLGADCVTEPAPDVDDGSSEGANRALSVAVEAKAALLRARIGALG